MRLLFQCLCVCEAHVFIHCEYDMAIQWHCIKNILALKLQSRSSGHSLLALSVMI